jgi:hypothetical protein
MLISSARSLSGITAAPTPVTTATGIVMRAGVLRAVSFVNHVGTSPSRDIAYKIRVWP